MNSPRIIVMETRRTSSNLPKAPEFNLWIPRLTTLVNFPQRTAVDMANRIRSSKLCAFLERQKAVRGVHCESGFKPLNLRWVHLAMGPPVNIPIPLKWVVHLPQNGTIGFDPPPDLLPLAEPFGLCEPGGDGAHELSGLAKPVGSKCGCGSKTCTNMAPWQMETRTKTCATLAL